MKYLRWAMWTVLTILVLGYAAMPTMIGCGGAMLTIHAKAIDAATGRPVPDASMTLVSERHPKGFIPPPFSDLIFAARTDGGGKAVLRESCGMGTSNFTVSLNAGSDMIRCEAAGYLPAEAPVIPGGRVTFNTFFGRPPLVVDVSLALTRRP